MFLIYPFLLFSDTDDNNLHTCNFLCFPVSVETRQSLLETVMLLTPYNIALGTDICQKLLKVDEGTHNPQIKDKILKHLNYFKQRLPYNSV